MNKGLGELGGFTGQCAGGSRKGTGLTPNCTRPVLCVVAVVRILRKTAYIKAAISVI